MTTDIETIGMLRKPLQQQMLYQLQDQEQDLNQSKLICED